MVSATVMGLVAAVGAGFGWQPMPDGSAAYEYVVQVDPEMVASLEPGQSIPIVSEVPAGIGPIARVRVTIGGGALPQRRLLTRRNPTTEGDAATLPAGVVLTQYTEGADVRYGTQPAAALDPYTQAAPGAGAAWNGGPAAPNPLRVAAATDATNLAPEATWNGAGIGAEAPDSSVLAAPVRRIGDGLREATQPVQEGFDRFGRRIRTAAENLGDGAEQLLDGVRQPFQGLRPGAAPTVTTAPPYAISPTSAGPATAGAGTAAPAWNGGDGPTYPVADPAGAAGAGTAWNGATSATAAPPFAGSGLGGAAGGPAPPPLVSDTGVAAGGLGAAGRRSAPGGVGAGAGGVVDANSWDNAIDPRFRTGAPGATPASVAAGGDATITWPGDAASAAPPLSGGGASGANAGADVGTAGRGPVLGDASGAAATAGAAPEVRAGMLSLPGDRSLDGAAGAAASSTGALPHAAPVPGTAVGVLPPAAGTGSLPNPLAAQGWDASVARPAGASPSPAAAPPGSEARSKGLILIAWVLLSGSAAGNIYLFWSYLDVRTKYRALVRKTARAVGSRFSAA